MEKNVKNDSGVYGISACYGDVEKFLLALRQVMEAKYSAVETYTPFPVDETYEILKKKKPVIQWAVFIGGLLGGGGGFFMEWFANVIQYPLNIGGRPFNSWPAFIPILFEMTVLFGALFGFAAFLLSCRLPKLYHPIFRAKGFEKVTLDSFFLCIQAKDPRFDREETKKFLQSTKADSVDEVSDHEDP